MNYDTLMQKLATADLPINRRLNQVMDKVKVAGLHRAAAGLYGVPTLNIKAASQLLGQNLLSTHLKFKKVAMGLDALSRLPKAP